MKQRLTIIVTGLVALVGIFGWFWQAGYLEEAQVNAQAKRFASDVFQVLKSEDYDRFIALFDTLETKEYEALTEEEKSEVRALYEQSVKHWNETLGENWIKQVKYMDSTAYTVEIPERTAIEGYIEYAVKTETSPWIHLEFVIEDGQMHLTNGLSLIENLQP